MFWKLFFNDAKCDFYLQLKSRRKKNRIRNVLMQISIIFGSLKRTRGEKWEKNTPVEGYIILKQTYFCEVRRFPDGFTLLILI